MDERARLGGVLFLTWFIIGGWVPPATAQEDVFTPERMAETKAVTAAEISPDGTRVAYTLSVPRPPMKDEDGPNRTQLHVVDL